jgi:hypothetical protein
MTLATVEHLLAYFALGCCLGWLSAELVIVPLLRRRWERDFQRELLAMQAEMNTLQAYILDIQAMALIPRDPTAEQEKPH